MAPSFSRNSDSTMNLQLELLKCGGSNRAQLKSIALPNINCRSFIDTTELMGFIADEHGSYYIVLLLGLDDSRSNSDLQRLQQQHNVLTIFISIKRKSDIPLNASKICHVFEPLISYKIKTKVIEFFENARRQLLESNQIVAANILKCRVNQLKQQRITNTRVLSHYLARK